MNSTVLEIVKYLNEVIRLTEVDSHIRVKLEAVREDIVRKFGELPEEWHITKAQIAEFQKKGAAPSEYVAAAIGSIMPNSMDTQGVGGFTSVDVTIAFINGYPVAAAEMLRHLMDQGVAAHREANAPKIVDSQGRRMGGG